MGEATAVPPERVRTGDSPGERVVVVGSTTRKLDQGPERRLDGREAIM
jgi:hypothetical protein